MAEYKSKQDFLKSRESYDTAIMSAYARDILTTSNRPYYIGTGERLSASRELPEIGLTIYLTSKTVDSGEPSFQIERVYEGSSSISTLKYRFTAGIQHVSLHDENGVEIDSDTPIADTMQAMQLLRLGWLDLEPLGNAVQESEFGNIMANIALDSVFQGDNGEAELRYIADSRDEEREMARDDALEAVMQQGVGIGPRDGAPYLPYTYDKMRVQLALALRINRLLARHRNSS